MQKLLPIITILMSLVVKAQINDQGIFKDIKNQSIERHYVKIVHNVIASEILIGGSLAAYGGIINNKYADRNLASFLKPVSIVAGVAGIISAYSAIRHAHFRNKKLKIAPAMSGLGIGLHF